MSCRAVSAVRIILLSIPIYPFRKLYHYNRDCTVFIIPVKGPPLNVSRTAAGLQRILRHYIRLEIICLSLRSIALSSD